jgi:metal-responsive CopG/Arc/MetJ family transcriptional regulator
MISSKARRMKNRVQRTASKPALSTSKKVAVDFPASLFQETEQAAKEISTTRSALIRIAVEAFLQNRKRQRLEDQIAESLSANAKLDRRLMEEFRHVDAEAGSHA